MANTTFDSASLSNATLSGGDLTVAHSNTSLGGVFTAELKTSGKYYFEITMTDVDGDFSCVGLLSAFGSLSNLVNDGTNCSAVYATTGNIYSGDANSGKSLSGLTDGDLICIAADFDNDIVGFRKGAAGAWNGDGSYNPVAATGGVSIAGYVGTAMGPAVGFGGTGTSATETFTANFGDSAFTGAVPAGFTSGWPTAGVGGGDPPGGGSGQNAPAMLSGL